jgi:hypothetical protein
MSCETNLLKENNVLKNEVKKLSNKLEKCYNSKVTFEYMLKTQRNFGDKSGLGFKRKMTKGERKRAKEMKKQLQLKLSHSMCYQCHEARHLANGCPNTLGVTHLNVPNQTIGEATSRASTKATS